MPEWVEEFAADFIEAEASRRVDASIEAIRLPESDSSIGRLAQSLYERNEAQIQRLRTSLRTAVDEQWAGAIGAVRDFDCECRRRWEEWTEGNIVFLQAANDELIRFLQSTYMEVAAELKRDVRVFTASNAAVFLLLLLASFLKPQAMVHLFLPATLLAVSTLVCSYFYIFEQNWLLTIIFSNYVGFAYLGWLGIVFLLLCDIALNRGRVTTEILNAFLNAIGSAFSLVPC